MTEAPWIAITPMRMQFLPGYHACLDIVARERRYLTFTSAPPLEDSAAFVQSVLDAHFPMLVAITPGPTVIGWCDISPGRGETRAHVGTLGLGVHPDYRNQGIGTILIQRALKAARTCRLERVELQVYSDNTVALELYKSLDFEIEGIKRRARKLDGVYTDIILMVRHL